MTPRPSHDRPTGSPGATTQGAGPGARRRRRLAALAVGVPMAGVLALALPTHPGGAGPSSGRSTPPAATAPPGGPATRAPGTTHVVAAGETLSGLAARHGTTVAALAAANGIADPHLVLVGTRLQIPAGATGGGAGPGTATASGDPSRLPERLQASPERLALRPVFARWAAANGIPVDLLEAMTWLESGWQNHLVSPDGAQGIGQLMPATVDHMEMLIGVDLDPAVVEDNIRMSARYLRWLLHRTDSEGDALAAYYQGLAALERHGRYGETEQYVANVLALRERF